MQITVKREHLIKPLGVVAGVVERRQTLPILSNLLIRSTGKLITLTGTDLEVEVSASVSGSGTEGEMTLPARKLHEICRALPADSEISISLDKDKALIRSGKSRFKLLTMPVTEFPTIETASWNPSFSVPQKDLRWLLEKTMFCMAHQDVRYYLNGLLVEITSDLLRMVATDGHRLSLAEAPIKSQMNGQVILPRKGVTEIAGFLENSDDNVEVSLSANHLRVAMEGIVFTTKLIDGRFPDYSKVIPKNQGKHILVERDPFRETLGRVSILSNEKYRGVRFGLSEGAITITAHNPEQEEAQEELPISYKGEELEIGFNVNYINEAIGAVGSTQVEIGLNDPNSSCLIREPGKNNYLYVVMPMRL